MTHSGSAPTSPSLAEADSTLMPSTVLSESPMSTGDSTPLARPTVCRSASVGSVPPLRLDDIQSAIPFDSAPDTGEISATIAFPQDMIPGFPQVPSVTITTSHPHLIGPSTQESSPHPHTGAFPDSMPNVPFPREPALDYSVSTSSVLTEGDKLTELPGSFSSRFSAWTRRIADSSGIPAQDSFTSALTGHSGRHHNESDTSFSNKIRADFTPKRVSFEGDRPSFSSSIQNVRNATLPTMNGLAVFMPPSSPPLDCRANENSRSPRLDTPRSPKDKSPGRSPSPLRNFLWPLHRSHAREEPFIPVDPYKLNIFFPPKTVSHVISQITRQIYRHLLLRLPSIYFSRVSRVFGDAEVSRPEVLRMIEGRNTNESYRWPADHEWVAPNVSPALIRFKESWEGFVDSALKEWKTLNVVSALLLTCVVLLPIYGRDKPEIEGASTAPVIRTTAFLSLICALMSLVYGCVYILRFGTMKSMYRASKWAEEAQQGTSIFWNVWVLLAMPAVWISWSMLFFCVSILDFVWDQPFSTSVTIQDFSIKNSLPESSFAGSPLSNTDRTALGPRILISCVFILGVIYFALVVRTFRSWSDPRVPEDVREGMETGRWTPTPASPRQDSRLDRPKGLCIVEERPRAKQLGYGGRARAHSVDSAV